MLVRRVVWTVLLCTVVALITGCGGSRDKGKNQDLDRPKPAATWR